MIISGMIEDKEHGDYNKEKNEIIELVKSFYPIILTMIYDKSEIHMDHILNSIIRPHFKYDL